MEDDYLTVSDGSRMHFLPKKSKYYVNKLTLVFGGSGSGKTTLVDEIMKLCKPIVPIVWVIARTNSANSTYDGKVAPICIQSGRDAKKTVKWLTDFLIRQKDAVNAYNKAHNIKILKRLFDKVSSIDRWRKIELKIKKRAYLNLMHVNSMAQLNPAKKRNQKKKMERDRDKTLEKLYRSVIRNHKVELESKRESLSDDEATALAFLDFNPCAMLILDDCASQLKLWAKMSTAIKELFYEGRHYFITTVIISQDDKEIDSELRKGSMVSLFTTDQIAISNFTRKSNSYPKHISQKAKACIETVFRQEVGSPVHFQKLAYIRGLTDPFRYTVADLYDDFKMGAPAVWELDKRISENSHKKKIQNPLIERYI